MTRAIHSIPKPDPAGPLIAFHLLGTVDFDACLALQARLVYEAGGRDDDRIVVLLCEHPPLITIGRNGSRGHVRLTEGELRRAQLPLRWISRGGGTVLHAPGQLAIYPIVPLERRGWSVGEYLRRLKQGLADAITSLQVKAQVPDDRPGVWGRRGQMAAVGIGVRNWVTLHGAWLNVHPAMHYFGRIDVAPPLAGGRGEKTTMSSLLSERQEPVTMTKVRAALTESLSAAFESPRQIVTSGHPLFGPAARIA